ncbi:MAG: DUF3365 domain-containing protein [Magnetovibrio sp.]|nr:DUF3365 domain-containing protein [Magnetovibrio sp.]
MNKSITLATLALTLSVSTVAHSADTADTKALMGEAAGVVKAFGGPLKQTLVGAMKSGGPAEAIGACNEKAPNIAKNAAQATGWSVGRTSLKLRNPGNEADAWEMKVLKQFDERKAAGEKPGAISYGEVVEMDGKKQYRFMKAIGTAELCLNCHGKTLKPEVAAKLDGLYPDDKARGYNVGDIRGAFTLVKDL